MEETGGKRGEGDKELKKKGGNGREEKIKEEKGWNEER